MTAKIIKPDFTKIAKTVKNINCSKHDPSCGIFKNPRGTTSLDINKCNCGATGQQGMAKVAEQLSKQLVKEVVKQEQDSEQQLTSYYKTTFTLKKNKRIVICHRETFKDASCFKSRFGISVVQMKGFSIKPLLVEKSIEITLAELVLIETIVEPCIAQVIPWPKEEEPWNGTIADVTTGQTKEELAEPNQASIKTMADHKSTCAVRRYGGISSEMDCDCGAIVACKDK